MKNLRYRLLPNSLQQKLGLPAQSPPATATPAPEADPAVAPLPPASSKRSSARAIFDRIKRQHAAPPAPPPALVPIPLPRLDLEIPDPFIDLSEDAPSDQLDHSVISDTDRTLTNTSDRSGRRHRYIVDSSSTDGTSQGEPAAEQTPAPEKTPFVPRERNRAVRAAGYLGRKLQPNQVVLDGGMPLVSYRLEPAGRFDSQGFHKPGDNYSTLENKHIDYQDYQYEPITYDLSPGQVNKGRPHLNTAFRYGAEKLITRDGKPARYPVPGWMRQIGVSSGHAFENLVKKRLSRPKALLTRQQADEMLENRRHLLQRTAQLFNIAPGDRAGAARVEALLQGMEYMGMEGYPAPAWQKQGFLIEALALSSGGNLEEAADAAARIRGGLDPVAASMPEIMTPLEQRQRDVTWRTAQILASAGGDGFDTLLKAGAVRDIDNQVLLPQQAWAANQRRQEAFRVYLEVAAQTNELAVNGKTRPGKLAFQADTRRYLAQLAALKLWSNPLAGNLGPDSRVPAHERLTRPEKNAYYEWSQNFGRLGAEGMVNKTRDRLHKVATTYMDRAQEIGFDDFPTLDTVDPRRALGMNKSPMTALNFGTRGAHRRTANEIRTQYDTILRPVLRQLSRHYEDKVAASRDYTSLVRNLIDLEVTRHWNAHAHEQNAEGRYVHRPLGEKLTPEVQASVMNAVKATLNDSSPEAPLSPALRALIPGRQTVVALTAERSWITRAFKKNSRFSLDHLSKLVRAEGMGDQVMSDALLGEFGLNLANRKNLGSEMAKYRLFGIDGTRDATVSHFLDRAHNIRNDNDSLRPVMGQDGSAITALKEFNDTYILEEPMGPRVRAQDGGIYGINNIGLALNMAHMYVAPNPTFSNDKRAFVEYNSGGHAFEVAYGVQKTVNAGLGVSAGHGFLLPDGSIVSATGTLGTGLEWTNQEAVRLRGRRELNDKGEAYLVADNPGGPNHGRLLRAAESADGQALVVDEEGRLAISSTEPNGNTRYTYQDRREVLFQTPAGLFLNRRRQPLLDAEQQPVAKYFGKAYVYADDGRPANDVARMDKARYHLMQATDFIFRQAENARSSGEVGTSAALWDAWVDEFFDNPDVSISYQHHRNVGQNITGQVGVTVRRITDADARPGGGVSLGHTERPYEALNRSDQTGRINRTMVQIGYSGNNNLLASASVGTPGLSNAAGAVSAGGLPAKLGGFNATFGDHGVLAAFRTVEADGKITPEFTYMDIEYRNVDLYKHYVLKNRKVWESFYGKDNLKKNLEKLERESEPNQRFAERWRLSPEGVHKLRSYLALAKIQKAGSRGDQHIDSAELKKIEAEEITRFAAQMLEDRNLWDPLGAYVVEVNSKERAIGPNFLLQAQQVTRSVADAELDWIGGSSAGMNAAARLRAERHAERKRENEMKAELDEIARSGAQFLPEVATDNQPLVDIEGIFPAPKKIPQRR